MTSRVKPVVLSKLDMLDDKSPTSSSILLTMIIKKKKLIWLNRSI